MANTYNYNGEMLRPSAILKHYPNISIATGLERVMRYLMLKNN